MKWQGASLRHGDISSYKVVPGLYMMVEDNIWKIWESQTMATFSKFTGEGDDSSDNQ